MDTEPREVAAREARHRTGLERIKGGGAPGHRAGVPVLELSAGSEHEWIFGIGALIGRSDLRRHELAAPILRRETLAEHHVVARGVGGIRGICDGVFPLYSVPRNVVERRHQRSHLGIDLARMLIIPIKTYAARQLLCDPPIGLCLA